MLLSESKTLKTLNNTNLYTAFGSIGLSPLVGAEQEVSTLISDDRPSKAEL